ncbi:MAG: hypothetical protein A2086_02350 [Spirochaetes bacterium GWD1_27_9]|nr:MAG: hypothetical protein A2Z98_03340 [Spirochaetes bacterium GWB1_27_13]OHD24694.1 MAG: hypothetical protein A2Y34_10785 [Spirochaetes bacterium GWC1_27_15]OHD30417.1 MAG: hypothetical protein A2086_02350 [Spirochaetes bacterium GWD1_27_9]
MKRVQFIIFVAITLMINFNAQKGFAMDNILLIKNINIIPMNKNEVLYNKNVLIKDGIISDIFDHGMKTDFPENIEIIDGINSIRLLDGKNLFLIPGLTDMHVHINNKSDLQLFIKNGVTTVQNMWGYEGFINSLGFANQLKYKKLIEEGKLLGPHIISAGSIIEGKPKNHPFMLEVTNKNQAIKLVNQQIKDGYNFIKIYDNISLDVYLAISEECKNKKIPLKGHVPFNVGLKTVINAGQRQIDHLTGFLNYDKVQLIISDEEINQYSSIMFKNNVYACPTIVFTQKRVKVSEIEKMSDHPAMKYLNGMQKFFLYQSVKSLEEDLDYKGTDYQKDVFELYKKVILKLVENNAPILAGTDTGNPFVFPGYSLHEELQLLVLAGLSNYDALITATVNPMKSLNKLNEYGTVEIGKKADLIILNTNPLENISNSKDIKCVIFNGKIINIDSL